MKTTLDIPHDVASEVQRRAEQLGVPVDAQIVLLVRMGLVFGEIGKQIDQFVQTITRATHRLQPPAVANADNGAHRPDVQIDLVTGLPVIISPSDAPVYSMNADAVLAMEQTASDEEDLERAGISVRH